MNKKVSGTAIGIPAGLGLSTLISLVITLAGAALLAYMMTSEKIGEGAMGFSAMMIQAIASVAGAWCAVSVVKRLRLQMCMMAGACYYLTLLAMTALFFEGRYQGMGVSALIILAGCAIVAFIPVKNGSLFKKGKRAYR